MGAAKSRVLRLDRGSEYTSGKFRGDRTFGRLTMGKQLTIDERGRFHMVVDLVRVGRKGEDGALPAVIKTYFCCCRASTSVASWADL